MIRLTAVSKTYASLQPEDGNDGAVVHALRAVSLQVAGGEFVAVTGPSGCGKSTLLHLAGGLDTPSAGEVWVHDQPLHRLDERRLSLFRRNHAGVIFQFFNLLPQLTVIENVGLPLRFLGVSPAETESRAAKILEAVGLQGKSARLPAELSGGEQQRVAIARALVHRPAVVLADEPTGNLDSAASAIVIAVLRDLQKSHQTALLLVTHSCEVARAAHRVLAMQDGRILPSQRG